MSCSRCTRLGRLSIYLRIVRRDLSKPNIYYLTWLRTHILDFTVSEISGWFRLGQIFLLIDIVEMFFFRLRVGGGDEIKSIKMTS